MITQPRWEIRGGTLPGGHVRTVRIDRTLIFGVDQRAQCEQFIDARGMFVVPGGIDLHVHSRLLGEEHKEDPDSLTRAALLGGITTLVDMANNKRPAVDLERMRKKTSLMADRPINYHQWLGGIAESIPLISFLWQQENAIGVKTCCCHTTGGLYVPTRELRKRIAEACAQAHLINAVHAEDQGIIEQNLAAIRAVREPVVQDHGHIRNTDAELASIRENLDIAQETGCTMYFCHVSTPEGVELIDRERRKRELKVFIEVPCHYFLLSDELLKGEDNGRYKVNPPLRSEEQCKRLKDYVCMDNGPVDAVCSDHAPHRLREKRQGTYEGTPSGLPGVQTTLPLLFTLVAQGQMSMERFVALTSRNAAQTIVPNGVFASKGKIESFYEADLVVIKPEDYILRDEDMATKSRWTPFAGMPVKGRPYYVVRRGELVVNKGELVL